MVRLGEADESAAGCIIFAAQGPRSERLLNPSVSSSVAARDPRSVEVTRPMIA